MQNPDVGSWWGRKDYNSLFSEIGRNNQHNPNNRIQCIRINIQNYKLLGLGRGRSGKTAFSLDTLLWKVPRADLRDRQLWPIKNRFGFERTEKNPLPSRHEGLRGSDSGQQKGHRNHESRAHQPKTRTAKSQKELGRVPRLRHQVGREQPGYRNAVAHRKHWRYQKPQKDYRYGNRIHCKKWPKVCESLRIELKQKKNV